eukprot:329248_1
MGLVISTKEKNKPTGFGDVLSSSLELTLSIAGFMAGFTYIANVSNDISATFDGGKKYVAGGNVKRKDLFASLMILAFVFALGATFIAAHLIFCIRQVGLENAGELYKRHKLLCLMPRQFLYFSTAFMLVGALVAIGGQHTNEILWWASFIIGLIFGTV